MENLNIKGSNKSPALDFNYENGILDISGRSHPEHAVNIYEPALKWLDEYEKNPKPETTINVSLEYFNTSSSKIIIGIFKKLEKLQAAGNKIIIKWHYEEGDDDLLAEGEMFAELIKIPVTFVSVKEFDFVY